MTSSTIPERQADPGTAGEPGVRAIPGEGRHVLLAGGGSGGHVIPALSVADELLERGCRVSYAGSAKGIEERLAGERGLPFYPLPARPLVGQGPLGKVRTLAVLGRGALAARRLIRRLEVAALLGTGGYVSAPAVLGARLARRPTVLFEPNAHVGVANRQLSRFASEACVAFAEADRELFCPTRLTGTPVRAAFFEAPTWAPPAPAEDGGRRMRLLILGGSQGAVELNRRLPAALESLVRDGDLGAAVDSLAVTHQCGSAHVEEARRTYHQRLGEPVAGRPAVEVDVVPFLDDMSGAMAASHLVITRGGAITLAEICAAGRPAVVLPLAAALGHQRGNAEALVAAGAAVMGTAPSADQISAELAALLGSLVRDPERLAAMASSARGLARAEAAASIANRVLLAAGGER